MQNDTVLKIKALVPTHTPSPAEIKDMRAKLNLSQLDFAIAFNLPYRIVQRSERGETELNPHAWEFVRQITEVLTAPAKPPAEPETSEPTKPTTNAYIEDDFFVDGVDWKKMGL